MLSDSGVVRSDITSSFGDASAVADGVPLTIDLTLLDVSGDSSGPLAGAAVYLWHCDAAGQYSLYSDAVADENYKMRTSQLALPADVAEVVYADDRYDGSSENLARTSLDSDNVFSDGYSLQLAKVTGTNESGYTARLTVPV